MSFAFGRDTQGRVIRAIANLARFDAGGLCGRPGPYRRLTSGLYGYLPSGYVYRLEEASYVVYCYGTPIAWVLNADGYPEPRINYLPDWQYSATTTYYQGLVYKAWGKITDPNPRLSKEENRGTRRGRTSDLRYGRTSRSRVAIGPEHPADALQRLEDEVTVGRTAPSGPPERLLEPDVVRITPYTEDRQAARFRRLLGPRYANPDWVPGRDAVADAEAEARDVQRVFDEGLWWEKGKAHP